MELIIRSKAIRAKCLDCSNYQQTEVRECPVVRCPLWPWRMGKQPSAEDLKTLKNTEDRQEYQKPEKRAKTVPQNVN